MKKAKKIVALVLCAALLMAGTVAATLAYLTDDTDTVTNSFSAGNVTITLDEAKVDVYGEVDAEADRVTENDYKLIPGHYYVKDPTIHVAKGSEVCYLFVEVVNGIEDIIVNDGENILGISQQMRGNGWAPLSGNIWYFRETVDARQETADVDVPVFAEFVIDGEANVSEYADKTITIKAYAVQADGFASASAAWDATFGK